MYKYICIYLYLYAYINLYICINKLYIYNYNYIIYIISLVFLAAQLERICLQCRRPEFNSWVGKFPWRRDRLPTPVFLGFPGGSAGRESVCNAGVLHLIPRLGRCPGGRHGNSLQYSCLENPHGQRSLAVTVHGVTKSDKTERLSTAHIYYIHAYYIYTIYIVKINKREHGPLILSHKSQVKIWCCSLGQSLIP